MDEERYEEIVKSFQDSIFHYCYHMLANRYEVEDAAQEVFIKAYHNLNKYRPEMPFGNQKPPTHCSGHVPRC